jgi:oligoribonuclease
VNDQKTNKKNNLVWIDLEMTGLDPSVDVILEAALVITDSQLKILYEGPVLIVSHPASVFNAIDPVVKNMHEQSGLEQAVLHSSLSIVQAEQELLTVVATFCESRMGVLCGNTIWQDRAFLARYMPRLIQYLHYRLIDVSSIKELVKRWYPHHPGLSFKKQDKHRALSDIIESIKELEHYRKIFFIDV